MTIKNLAIVSVLITGTALVPLTAMAHGKSDKEHVTKTYDYDDFAKISVKGVYDFDVQVGEDYSISLSGHEAEMDNTEVYVDDGVLNLSKKSSKLRLKNNKGIIVNITLPQLMGIDVGGVGEGEVSGIDSDAFSLAISGAGELTLSGTCGSMEAYISGVGEVDAKNLECEDATARLSGVGELSLYASQSVDVKTSGVGEVNVYGKPEEVSKSKSFMSNVNIK